MEKLNSYLQQMLNTRGYELRLEPNKNPYILTAEGRVDAANTPLPGTQINSMVFALIPNEVKQQLPNQPEVDFEHPHVLGRFGFNVKKSPVGFNVTVKLVGKGVSSAPVAASTENSVNENTMPQEEVSETESYEVELTSAPQPAAPEVSNPITETAEEYSPEPLQPEEEMAPEYSGISEFESGAIEIEVEPSDTPVASQAQQNDEAPVHYEIEHGGAPLEERLSTESKRNVLQNQNPEEPEVVVAVPEYEMPVIEPTVENIAVESDYSSQQLNQQTIQTEQIMNQVQTSAPSPTPQPTSVPVPRASVAVDPKRKAEIDSLFAQMAKLGASDLHLSVSMPPLVRMDGKMKPLVEGAPKLTPDAMKALLTSIMPRKNLEEFAERKDTDFAYEIKGLARFRANIFMDRKGMGGVFRIIPSEILTAEQLKLPKAIMDLCELTKGLVVVTGPTGSGKSTTLCAMVDSINKSREDHIITIEDPIEFTHENIKCLVNQREVHNHTDSFKDALRAALREDPDILLVGEMRDLETISIAIETAETGHLVFGTLHTTTAASTVDRIIDQFPADRQQQIRVMLSESLKGVIAQTLLPKIGGGRIAALEILIVTPAVANLIREGKTFQIASQMQTGKNLGMKMLNDSLMELVNEGLVEPKDAWIKSVDKTSFEMLLQRNGKKI